MAMDRGAPWSGHGLGLSFQAWVDGLVSCLGVAVLAVRFVLAPLATPGVGDRPPVGPTPGTPSMTIKDVAGVARVSLDTVSRVVAQSMRPEVGTFH